MFSRSFRPESLPGCMLLICAGLSGCKPQESLPAAKPQAVEVVSPQLRTLDPQILLTGTVTASEQVQLSARVAGTLNSLDFKDGSMVKAGQLLFTIDDASYQAQLAGDQAAVKKTERDLDRQQALYPSRVTSLASLQDAQTQRDQARAQRDISQINLSYTKVVAPFSGRIGRHQVDAGNLVGQSGDTVIVTLNKIDPLYVTFTVNQPDAARFGLISASSERLPELPVDITVPGSATQVHSTVNFVDNQLDNESGALTLRATVSGKDTGLAPGMLVNVTLHKGLAQKTRQIPSSAVMNTPEGETVFVVADKKVHSLKVTTAAGEGENRTLITPENEPLPILLYARPELVGQTVTATKVGEATDD